MKNILINSSLALAISFCAIPSFAGSAQSLEVLNVPSDYSITISKKTTPQISTKDVATTCTQLEKSVNIPDADCGRYSLGTLAKMAHDLDRH